MRRLSYDDLADLLRRIALGEPISLSSGVTVAALRPDLISLGWPCVDGLIFSAPRFGRLRSLVWNSMREADDRGV